MVEIGIFTFGMIMMLAGIGIVMLALSMTIFQMATSKKNREKMEQRMKEKY